MLSRLTRCPSSSYLYGLFGQLIISDVTSYGEDRTLINKVSSGQLETVVSSKKIGRLGYSQS